MTKFLLVFILAVNIPVFADTQGQLDLANKIIQKQQEKIDLQDQESQILEQRLQIYINESNILAKNTSDQKAFRELEFIGSFALGVLATVLVVRNVRP